MPALANKQFLGAMDAHGTDGSDSSKMSALYKVVDSELINYDLQIAKTIHDSANDQAISDALQAELDKIG